ncbi:MAG: HlyC/CorC family transporter [Chloroflexi bacterium]|nr:HlyC/CorC family transporter [Chloroflexota bacterium]
MSEVSLTIDFNTGLAAIAILLFLNSILAMAETALLSARKARLQNQSNQGDLRAASALKLTENPNQFLSVIQIGITSIDLLVGALTGATLGLWINTQMDHFPVLEPYSEIIGLLVGVLPVTYVSLVLGELVPKRLAMRDPERISSMVAGPMTFFSVIFSPFVRLLSFSTESVLRLMGVKPSEDPPVTEEEIQLLIDQGTQAGVFEESEQDMVEGVFSLGDQRVYSLMTPRTDIIWLDINDSPQEILQKIAESEYSRFPVCDGSLDKVLGIVKARDLLVPSLAGEPINLKEKLRPALYIPETSFASRALEIFKEQNRELMLVIDEFGSLQGILTLNDIIEEIVGDFEVEPQATQRQDGSWLLDGMLSIDDFKEIFNLRTMPHESEYETLSGFMMTTLGRVPQPADKFEWNTLTFEVMDMDGNRVDKVLVTTLASRTANNAETEGKK